VMHFGSFAKQKIKNIARPILEQGNATINM
jgi:hypothetical protein